jgi:hypothetical protein
VLHNNGENLSFQGRPEDIRDWDAWECSFYGEVPSLSGESEGSIVLPMDVQIDKISWKCPELLGSWALEFWVDEEMVFNIEPQTYAIGEATIKGYDFVVLKGSSLITKLYYLGESDDYPQYEKELGKSSGYSIFIAGYSARQEHATTIREYLLELPPEMKNLEFWQEENA